MAIYDEVFYFYGTLSPDGVLQELKGKIFADAQGSIGNFIGKKFYLSDLWQDDPHLSAPRNSNSVKNAVEEASAGKTTSIEADFHLTPDTTEKVKLTLAPVTAEDGRVKEIFFSALDVSVYLNETAIYKEKSEQLFYAAETAEVGLFFWDVSKDEIFTTPRFNEFYGLKPQEIMTLEKFSKVIHPEDMSLVEETISKSHTNFSECNVEYRVILNGEIRWLWVRGRTFQGDDLGTAFTMGSGRDITERKVSDDELVKLYASEKKARDEVEQAIQAKDHFIAMVSHELRAPLNSILGWVKILLSKEVDDETRINALETIERSARVQAKLISDLVDSSKIISGKLNLEFHPVNLPQALAYVVESQKPVAQAKNIELTCRFEIEDIKVNADLARLQQIFTNLITNAIKFTPEDGSITVDIKKSPDDISVSITDTGKGIDADELPYIFERYFQARVSESGDNSGLGLGLSIVSSLVRQHNGRVKAESSGTGRGSKFIVTLPILKVTKKIPERAAEKQAKLPEEPLEDLRILLVEDNDDAREIMQIFFEQMGANVIAAESAREAMEKLRSNGNLPDIMVSDISMPEEDGYSLIGKLRRLPAEKGGRIPAIALTALVSAEDERKLLAAGFQRHHSKPFEPERLIKEILQITKQAAK
jgi:PAS domain S-box-containing protein